MKIFYLSVAAFFLSCTTLFSQTTFQPTDLPGLTTWLIGDSVVLSGGNVQQWTDLSGNNHHAIQNAAANQPGYTSIPQLNNKPVIRLDGSSARLEKLSFSMA